MKAAGNLFKTVSNFLFSKSNREFLIFLFFFAIADVFWLLMTLNETYEQEIRVTVRYTNVPKAAVLTSAEVDTVRVTVKDKGYMLFTYLYGKELPSIDVDFKNYQQNRGQGVVPATDLTKHIATKLAASTKIISVKPDKLTYYYNYGEKKRVPVQWRGKVTPETLYYISDVIYQPDSITIYAPKEKLDSINTVYTEELDYTDFHDTLTVTARLSKLSGIKMVPENVTLSFMTDVLTEESIDGIPVIGINMPEGMVLRTFPAKVKVNFVAGIKTYRALSPKDFYVVADYEEFHNSPSPKCNIYLQEVPNGISRAKLEISKVDYLIEKEDR